GTGVEMEKLKATAGPTIEFLGNLTDEDLVQYYKGCRALIFPGIEDFGLTILEAQSFGKAVIAFKAGGALETIIEGKTGIFFNSQTVESLITGIKQFNGLRINPEDCIENAERFSFERFRREILKQVQNDIGEREKKI
ncbi:MAG: glycosyltransferase, partial [bacterium]|nr:glycosyltransferase [bacterium]